MTDQEKLAYTKGVLTKVIQNVQLTDNWGLVSTDDRKMKVVAEILQSLLNTLDKPE